MAQNMRLLTFDYDILPSRVRFGPGRISEVKQAVMRLGLNQVLLLATPSQAALAENVAQSLGEKCAGMIDKAVQHVPYETIVETMEKVKHLQIDGLLTLGGGSTVGLAKGLALEMGLPIIAVPTTYSGSEMTQIWGITREGRKSTGRDPIVKPKTVIYDPELFISLPARLSLISGINAMAHAVEALYAENANPITSIMAEESIRQLARSLPEVAADPADIVARSASLYGAWLAATVLDQVGMALHHKLCHTLGGSYQLPHAETHTVILPYAVAYNHSHAPQAMAAIARAIGCDVADVAGAIQDLSRRNGGPVSLSELGFDAANLDEAAYIATQNTYPNPRPVERTAIRDLFENAYYGRRP